MLSTGCALELKKNGLMIYDLLLVNWNKLQKTETVERSTLPGMLRELMSVIL